MKNSAIMQSNVIVKKEKSCRHYAYINFYIRVLAKLTNQYPWLSQNCYSKPRL